MNEEEQETFYSDCVHLMLNVYNNLENKNVLWSVVEEDIPPQMVREGRYLENMQIEPDILIYNDPASVLKGRDMQLEAAVEEMLKTIGEKQHTGQKSR